MTSPPGAGAHSSQRMAGPQRRQLPAIAFDGIGDKLPEDDAIPRREGRRAGRTRLARPWCFREKPDIPDS
jgi:hypothetical protein